MSLKMSRVSDGNFKTIQPNIPGVLLKYEELSKFSESYSHGLKILSMLSLHENEHYSYKKVFTEDSFCSTMALLNIFFISLILLLRDVESITYLIFCLPFAFKSNVATLACFSVILNMNLIIY